MPTPLITRAGWGARPPDESPVQTSWERRKTLRVHYSAGPPDQSVRAIQNFHMDTNGWIDVGYNALVDVEGRLYLGRSGGWLAIGAHAAGFNTEGIGVCFIGRDGDFTPAAARTLVQLHGALSALKGSPLGWGGHRDVNATECPGDEIYAWLGAGRPVPTETGDDDMRPYLLIRHQGGPAVYALFGNGAVRHVGPTEFAALQRAGVEYVTTSTDDEWGRLLLARIDN